MPINLHLRSLFDNPSGFDAEEFIIFSAKEVKQSAEENKIPFLLF